MMTLLIMGERRLLLFVTTVQNCGTLKLISYAKIFKRLFVSQFSFNFNETFYVMYRN